MFYAELHVNLDSCLEVKEYRGGVCVLKSGLKRYSPLYILIPKSLNVPSFLQAANENMLKYKNRASHTFHVRLRLSKNCVFLFLLL